MRRLTVAEAGEVWNMRHDSTSIVGCPSKAYLFAEAIFDILGVTSNLGRDVQ